MTSISGTRKDRDRPCHAPFGDRGMSSENMRLFREGLDRIGIVCPEEKMALFMVYMRELKKWNRAYNLTALKSDRDILVKHFLDSLLYLKGIPETRPRTPFRRLTMADIGTGAGFPGIPIKIIMPEAEMTLVESSRKRSVFLRHIIRTLRLDKICVLNSRIEDLGKDYEKTFDVIVSRATFKVRDFLKKACPYVTEDGVLLLSKGPQAFREVQGPEGPSKPGGIERSLRFSLFENERNLIVLRCRA